MACPAPGRKGPAHLGVGDDEVRAHAQADQISFSGILVGNPMTNSADRKRNLISQRAGAIIGSEGGYGAVGGGGNDAVA